VALSLLKKYIYNIYNTPVSLPLDFTLESLDIVAISDSETGTPAKKIYIKKSKKDEAEEK